jgi:hypothetical protein
VPPAEGLDLRPGWRSADASLEADAVAFWERLKILPAGVDPVARAKELVAGCYKDGRLIAVQTAKLEVLDFVRARFAVIRSAVDPKARRSHAAATLAYFCRELLDRWSLDNPAERLAGTAAYLESRELGELQKEPYWPATRLMLARFLPDGRQVRLGWFDHYRTD